MIAPLLLACSLASAQTPGFVCAHESGAAAALPPYPQPAISVTGEFRAIVLFVQFRDDFRSLTTNCGPDDWPVRDSSTAPATMPVKGFRLLAATPAATPHPESITAYFHEISGGAWTVYGDEFPYVTQLRESQYRMRLIISPPCPPEGCNNPNVTVADSTGRAIDYGKIAEEALAALDARPDVALSDYDADGNGVLDHVFFVLRSATVGYGIYCMQDGTGCASGISDLSYSTPASTFGVSIDSDYSGSFNMFQSIEPVIDNTFLLAHEIGHDIWGPHLGPVAGNGVPFLPPSTPGGLSTGDRVVAHALMVSRQNSDERISLNYQTSAAERAYVARTITNPDSLWIDCVAPTDGQIVTLSDVAVSGDCIALPVGTADGRLRELYLSNVQRTTRFSQMSQPYVNIGGGCSSLGCGRIEWGLPTAGMLVEYVEREPGARGAWSRDVVTADDQLSDFPGCSQYVDVDPSAEDVFGGDFWRPGVDRQLTPWTRPNVYGRHTLDGLAPNALTDGLHAIDDIRSVTGTDDIRFDYYRNYPDAPVAFVRENWWVTSHTDSVAVFNELRVLAGDTLFVEAGAEMTFMGNLVVEAGAALDLEGTLRFGPAAGLVVYGDMRAEGGAMVALDPTLGWRGVRLETNMLSDPAGGPPAPGTVFWTGTTVADVAIPAGSGLTSPAAVVVFNRHLVMADGQIRDTENGSGLYVASGNAWISNGARFENNEDYGLVTGADGHIVTYVDFGPREVTITSNEGGGVSAAGKNATVYLASTTVNGNFGVGVEARAKGTATFSSTERVTVADNQGGLSARGGGSLFAGACTLVGGQTVCTAPAIGHSIAGNAPGGNHYDARSLSGAVLYAEGNEWGAAQSPVDLILISDAQSFLSVCPFVGGAAGTCAAASSRAGGPQLARQSTAEAEAARGAALSAPLFALATSRLAAGDTTGAVAAVTGALDAASTEDERVGAYEAAARLAGLVQPVAFVARLTAESAPEADPATRPWALRALVAAQTSMGDAVGAHAAATVLVDGYAGTEHEAEGHAARVLLAVGAADETAALAAYDALAPLDSLGAAVAGDLIAAAFAGESGGAALANRTPGGGTAETVAVTEASSAAGLPAEIEVGRVAPNPTSAQALVVVGLPVAATVGVEVYDALGRRVWSSPASERAPGYHRLGVDARRLAPGLYVARVRIAGASGAARVETRRFVVVR